MNTVIIHFKSAESDFFYNVPVSQVDRLIATWKTHNARETANLAVGGFTSDRGETVILLSEIAAITCKAN